MKLVHEQAQGTDQGLILQDLAREASIEATPSQILDTHDVAGLLPGGTSVYVPFLPGADFQRTVDACRKLIGDGMHPVPHVPARAVESHDQLRDWLAGLTETGTHRIMLIAGDNDAPAGPFDDTLGVLESGLLADHHIHQVGIAGHPDGHPVAGSDLITSAMARKRDYAIETGTHMWVVTQFAFDSDTFFEWLEQHCEVMTPMPVYFGLAGPTKLTTLIAYAARCGVGVSARMMKRRPSAARLLTSWTPDGLMQSIAQHVIDEPHSLLAGIHVFPFGGLERSAQWLHGLCREANELNQQPSQAGV
ncbi:methylenetetrahydrofolate reductase [Tamilnaduibacter salinus]|uniref:Methylenetetrahydrofolate reductase n=1 Tax=Tamilnaduibacter salinus TaxID=1484056 RepID=A0A2A2I791_9GAMM|nr:methylenetetrahydrofolate reductase [Tamilnaduibacter salinus]PAV27258.1 methylenetetrahydrofolate reductase [Tamilnaduibacter salinus]